jgi:hypothetical protein
MAGVVQPTRGCENEVDSIRRYKPPVKVVAPTRGAIARGNAAAPGWLTRRMLRRGAGTRAAEPRHKPHGGEDMVAQCKAGRAAAALGLQCLNYLPHGVSCAHKSHVGYTHT